MWSLWACRVGSEREKNDIQALWFVCFQLESEQIITLLRRPLILVLLVCMSFVSVSHWHSWRTGLVQTPSTNQSVFTSSEVTEMFSFNAFITNKVIFFTVMHLWYNLYSHYFLLSRKLKMILSGFRTSSHL